MTKNLIEIQNANLFLDGKQILHDINWQVLPSEHWFIIGPNGSGKTTLTRMLLGYIWPIFGAKVSILGNTYGDCNIFAVRKKIAWISPFLQNWTSASKDYTVEEIIISGIDSTIGLFRAAESFEINQAAKILDEIGGSHLRGKTFVHLSSGEQIIVLMARALIKKPELIIFDEVCAHLDLKNRELFLEIIDNFARDKNSPVIIFVTQRIEDITGAFEKGLALKNGRILVAGEKKDVLSEENLKDIFDLDINLIKTDSGRYWPIVGK